MKITISDYKDIYHCPRCGNKIESNKICSECGVDLSEIIELIAQGRKFYDLGKYPDAIECYDKVIKRVSNCSEAWCGKGDVLLKQGENSENKKSCSNCPLCPVLSEVFYTDAMKCYEKAIKINPNDSYALYQKEIILGRLGKYSKAKK
ncbi:MAG TPA: tetratricopeptide repeat protein [Methanofastidiosum sp.]|nr:tetratricopeptide repeat protein [Methanofastidiosum sp.]HOC77160.1 tetratricopeptide repeat protein [Methanofastidiosum sp.]HOG73417.1 tetratricopeptide repeat protein [Methanofastidiosum sp.]HPA48546.1 tetratricopeptide repeat protein [Methanofastidiosum sp.]HQK62761.1 tetratricopeptide repeat protein [Methanofastidiosum sp.]